MTPVEKVVRAMTAIAYLGDTRSFKDIIESEREAFRGLQVVFATKVKQTDIHGIQMNEISDHCPLVCNTMGAQGLLFYSDKVYANTLKQETEIAVDYSISFDKNICKNVNLLAKGKNLDQPENFRALLQLVKGRGDQSLNFDYFAYLAEEHEHFFVPGNTRPKDTLRALKMLDFIVPDCLYQSPMVATYCYDEAVLSSAVEDAMRAVVHSEFMDDILARQHGTYAMILKAVLLSWRKDLSLTEKLRTLVLFSMRALGKFSKTEIYMGWKMFGGAGLPPPFFSVVAAPSASSLQTIRGMAWDVTQLRITEQMSGVRRTAGDREADFFIPFIASYDKKFKLLIEACPVRALVTAPELGLTNTIFRDEVQFRTALELAHADRQLGTFAEQSRRVEAELDSHRIAAETAELENELERICAAVASQKNDPRARSIRSGRRRRARPLTQPCPADVQMEKVALLKLDA
jgi:hypothetical protein